MRVMNMVLLIRLENDNRFFKIFELIVELSEKSNILKQVGERKISISKDKMEAKFFSEIEKNMDVETLKDFEKEVKRR